MRPLPPEADRADGTDRRQTRPEPVKTIETDELWLEVQEF
jgi:hypothetical protein